MKIVSEKNIGKIPILLCILLAMIQVTIAVVTKNRVWLYVAPIYLFIALIWYMLNKDI